MNKKLLLFISFFIFCFNIAKSQEQKNVYNPNENVQQVLNAAMQKAKAENKHIFVQIGGNWCPWCVRMHKFYHENHKIDSIMKANYVTMLVNYSRENKNLDFMKKYKYPQRFGFPVVLILNENGELLHTQNSMYLETKDNYDEKLFVDFLISWNKDAFNPKNYK